MTGGIVRHATPAFRTYAGTDALSLLPAELDQAGVSRVLVVTGRSMSGNATVMGRISQLLGARLVAVFDRAREHSPLPEVLDAVDLIDSSQVDGVVALGGGSAIVTARAAVILSAERRAVRELCTHRGPDGQLVSPRLAEPKVPQWIIPSTPTTACAKAGAAVRDTETGERLALFDPKARARGVFVDAMIVSTAPPEVVRSAALNALAMSVDGLQASGDDLLAEALLRQALVTLTDHGMDLASGRLQRRVHLVLAALLAGQGSDFVASGLAQALAHSLGPLSSVGNGVVEALLLPYTMRFNRGVTDAGLTLVAQTLGATHCADPAEAVTAVEVVLRKAAVPPRLREVGVDSAALTGVVEHVATDWAAASAPRRASSKQLAAILRQAW